MSFLFKAIAIPFWLVVFIVISASPLWIRWYRLFHEKYIKTGILKRKLGIKKSNDEVKQDILKKATDHWTTTSEMQAFSDSKVTKKAKKKTRRESDPVKRENIIKVLKVLAEQGEKGALPKSISDITSVNYLDTSSALLYLVEKKYAEAINGTLGEKYYLTSLGQNYCVNKKIISS